MAVSSPTPRNVSEFARPVHRADFRLWFWWVIANVVGFGLIEALGTVDRRLGFAGVPMLATGVAQWLVLRRYAAIHGLWWVLATMVGIIAIFVVLFPIAFGDGYRPVAGKLLSSRIAETYAVAGAVGGTVLGILQWLALRTRFTRAGWWVVANGIAFAVAVPTLVQIDALRRPYILRPGPDLVPWSAVGFGLVAGTITGAALILLRYLSRENAPTGDVKVSQSFSGS